MKKILFVMNPCAGQKKANRLLVDIVSIFNRAGYCVDVHITDGPGDAEKHISAHAASADIVVCCGGDGTFNETVSGVLLSGVEVPIGYIPAGSTNDFAASLGLSTDILQAATDIVTNEPAPFDMGSFNGRYFSYVASFGAFTRASYATPQSLKNTLGHAAYILSGISEISQIRTNHVSITLPNGQVIEDDFLFGAISNSTSMAGILTIPPDKVDMQDGLFELLLIRAPKNLIELSDCISAIQHQTYNCNMITFLSTPGADICAPETMDWTLDGEHQAGQMDIHVENLHHAVNVIRREKT